MTLTASGSSNDDARDRLRREHDLRTISDAEEGYAASKLPVGVYGFTNAPLTESPLFAKRAHHSFEVHKTADGECRLVVFVTPPEAAAIRSGDRTLELHLYPDAWENATEPLSIPYRRLSTKKLLPSREPGNWITATVFPAE